MVQRPRQSQSDQTKQLLEKGGKKKQGRPRQGRHSAETSQVSISSKLSMISATSIFFYSNLNLKLLTSVMVCYDTLYVRDKNIKISGADEVINVWIFKNNLLSFFPVQCSGRERERGGKFLCEFLLPSKLVL